MSGRCYSTKSQEANRSVLREENTVETWKDKSLIMSDVTKNSITQPDALKVLTRSTDSENTTIASIIAENVMNRLRTVKILMMSVNGTNIIAGILANLVAESVPKNVVAALKMGETGAKTHLMMSDTDMSSRPRKNTGPSVTNIEPNTQNRITVMTTARRTDMKNRDTPRTAGRDSESARIS